MMAIRWSHSRWITIMPGFSPTKMKIGIGACRITCIAYELYHKSKFNNFICMRSVPVFSPCAHKPLAYGDSERALTNCTFIIYDLKYNWNQFLMVSKAEWITGETKGNIYVIRTCFSSDSKPQNSPSLAVKLHSKWSIIIECLVLISMITKLRFLSNTQPYAY